MVGQSNEIDSISMDNNTKSVQDVVPEVKVTVTDSMKKIVTLEDVPTEYIKIKRTSPHSRGNQLSPEGTLNADLSASKSKDGDITQWTLKGEKSHIYESKKMLNNKVS